MLDLYFSLWQKMSFYRDVELEISKRYSAGKMRCPTHLSVGQELVPAIVSNLKREGDFGVSTHRGHLHFLSFECSLRRMIAEIYGKVGGCSNGIGGSMHLADADKGFMGTSAIVGNSIPIGAGIALNAQLRKSDAVTFIFLGDGATEEGVFWETLNFCAIRNLNVMFVCENNGYSVYSGFKDRRPDGFSISDSVKPYLSDVEKVPFGEVEQCYKAFNRLYNAARCGRSSFIEVETYRHLEHCGPNDDNHSGYRSRDEFEHFYRLDPLKVIEKKLLDERSYAEKMEKVTDFNLVEILAAFDFAENSPFPKKEAPL